MPSKRARNPNAPSSDNDSTQERESLNGDHNGKSHDGKRKRNRSDMEHNSNDYHENEEESKEDQKATPFASSAAQLERKQTVDPSTSSALIEYKTHFPPPPKPPPSLSIESLLSVPLPFVFRQTDSNNSNNGSSPDFLLSRVEATILLQISQLAHEMDVLTSMTLQALDKSRIIRNLHRSIHGPPNDDGGGGVSTHSNNSNNTLYLRSVEPMLHVHGRTIPQRVLQYVQVETERILGNELPSLGGTLRQFSEQNWCVANTLLGTIGGGMMDSDDDDEDEDEDDDDGGTVGRLAREKKAVAELEEEVCRRIDGLVRMGGCSSNVTHSGSSPSRSSSSGDNADDEMGDAFDMTMDSKTGEFISMAEYCGTLFNIPVAAIVEYKGGSNGDLDGSKQTPMGGTEISNACSLSENLKKGDTDVVKSNTDDSRLISSSTSTSLRNRGKRNIPIQSKSQNHSASRPSPVTSHENCDGASSKCEEHLQDDDSGDTHLQFSDTQAPQPTSNSLDDAAMALEMLSSGKSLDRVVSGESTSAT